MSSSRVELVWGDGTGLERVLKELEAFARAAGLCLGVAPGAPLGQPYTLGWRRQQHRLTLEYTCQPWEFHPLRDAAFRNLTWDFQAREIVWFRCCIFSSPEESVSCLRDGKVSRLIVNFDEEPNSWDLSQKPEEAERAVRKYRQIQDLYVFLGCDEANGYSDSHYSAGTALTKDPEHIQKIFRFAKSGRNVLIVPMEEGRPRRVGETEWRRVADL